MTPDHVSRPETERSRTSRSTSRDPTAAAAVADYRVRLIDDFLVVLPSWHIISPLVMNQRLFPRHQTPGSSSYLQPSSRVRMPDAASDGTASRVASE